MSGDVRTDEQKQEDQKKYFKMLLDEPDPVQGVSVHTRYLPKTRVFQHPLYMFKFDCRYPPRSQGWGSYFRREDHFGDVSKSLDECVRNEIKTRLNYDLVGRIDMVCNLTFLGYSFNPITPYFCHDEFDHLVALLVEVHNTPWGEKCIYAMRVGEVGSMRHDKKDGEYSTLLPALHSKVMHVSPFNPPPPPQKKKNSNKKQKKMEATVDKTEDQVTLETQQQLDVQNQKEKEVSWYYLFKLKGKTHITVEVFKHTPVPDQQPTGPAPFYPTFREVNAAYTYQSKLWDIEKDEKYITASWDITGLRAHEVHSGSIRTVLNVYMQAFKMFFIERMQVYWYQPAYTSLKSSAVWGWLLVSIPACMLLWDREGCRSTIPHERYTAIAMIGISLCMSLLAHTSGTYVPLLWISVILGGYVATMLFKSTLWMDLNILFLCTTIILGLWHLITGHGQPYRYFCAMLMSVVTYVAIKREECDYPNSI